MLQAMATFKSTLQHVPPGQEAGISINLTPTLGEATHIVRQHLEFNQLCC